MILAVQHSDHNPNIYAVFTDEKLLELFDISTGEWTELVLLPDIEKAPVKLYFHHPYICVSERLGLHAAVVNSATAETRHFIREDYHSDVSSFSIGFLKRNGSTLLIHQTQWNRLDITDLVTGELLTEREVSIREVEPEHKDEDGNGVRMRFEKTNYLDYFHSLLQISPDNRSFLSNGWVWSPMDNIRCFTVDRFLQEYEPGSIGIAFSHGYNWDRPCTYIDDDCFVIAADDTTTQEDLPAGSYHQLQFYWFSDRNETEWSLPCFKQVKSNVFPLNEEENELFGGLWYDSGLNQLIALSEKGAFGLDLEGKELWHKPEIFYTPEHVFDYQNAAVRPCGWQYSPEHHRFYRYHHDRQELEVVLV